MFRHARHVILDRDGLLNLESADGGYVSDWSQWQWIPGAIDGLRMLSSAGVRISICTNQSGVGRGLIERGDLDVVHARMVEDAAGSGGFISAVFVCPHLPDSGCDCRKPAPGLLLRAMAASRVDRCVTVALGDDIRDLEAAKGADVEFALVRTGKGRRTESIIAARTAPVFEDLLEFAADVLSDCILQRR